MKMKKEYKGAWYKSVGDDGTCIGCDLLDDCANDECELIEHFDCIGLGVIWNKCSPPRSKPSKKELQSRIDNLLIDIEGFQRDIELKDSEWSDTNSLNETLTTINVSLSDDLHEHQKQCYQLTNDCQVLERTNVELLHDFKAVIKQFDECKIKYSEIVALNDRIARKASKSRNKCSHLIAENKGLIKKNKELKSVRPGLKEWIPSFPLDYSAEKDAEIEILRKEIEMLRGAKYLQDISSDGQEAEIVKLKHEIKTYAAEAVICRKNRNSCEITLQGLTENLNDSENLKYKMIKLLNGS